jgi:hypothetical protein
MESSTAAAMESAAAAQPATATMECATAETAASAGANEPTDTDAMRVPYEPGRAVATGRIVRPVAWSEMVTIAASRETVAVAKEGSSEHEPWRVEAPSERIVKNSVARNKCIGVK